MKTRNNQSNWVKCVVSEASALSCVCVMAAATPVAMWDGDYSSLSQNGVTISLGTGNAVDAGNTAIIIGSSEGIRIGWDTGRQATTVVVKYGDLTLPFEDCGVIATSITPNGSCPAFGRPGVSLDADGGVRGTWSTGPWGDPQTTFVLGDGRGAVAYTYVLPKYDSSNSGTYLYQRVDGVWSRVFYRQALRDWDDAQVSACAFGGPGAAGMSGCIPLTGLRIESIAVFDATLTASELAEFSFPSDASNFRVSLSASGSPYTWSTLAWQGGAAPSSDTDNVVITVDGNVSLELDEATNTVGTVSVKGLGELHLAGAGVLVAKGGTGRSAFSTALPVVLSNGGDVYLPSVDFTGATTVGSGSFGVFGRETVSGNVTGTGTLRLESGRIAFLGSLSQAGGLSLGDGAVAVTETGSFCAGAITGSGTACFRKILPDATTAANFKNAEAWTGTCRLEMLDAGIKAIDANNWGTINSKVCFAGVPTSYILAGIRNLPEVVLEDVVEGGVIVPALVVSDGWNRWPTAFRKLSGSGTFLEASDNLPQCWYNVEDGSDFHGSINFCTMSISFGAQDFPPYVDGGWKCGRITVSTNATMEIANGAVWTCSNPEVGVRIDGRVRCCSGQSFNSKVDVRESGVLEMYMTRAQNEDSGKPAEQWENTIESTRSYWWLSGSGTVRLTDDGTDYSRMMPAGMWASTLALVDDQGRALKNGLQLHADGSSTAENPGVTYVGTLSGSGNFMADLWPYENDSRILEVTQGASTVWNGFIGGGYDRVAGLRVNGAVGVASHTLTISGNNTVHTNWLEVGATGSVKLDGPWKGDIVVSGEFGGVGTQTAGTLELADGAVLNGSWGAFRASSVADWPSTLTVRMDEVPAERRIVLLTCENGLPEGLDAVNVTFDGALKTKKYGLVVKNNELRLVKVRGFIVSLR